MKKRIDLSLILPCYNELPLFDDSMNRICQILDGSRLTYEIIFVDDGSRDKTRERIRGFLKKPHKSNRIFRALFHTKNMGRGKAVSDGFKAAKGEIIGYMDIDCEVSPVYIPMITDMLQHTSADMVIGKRIYRTTVTSLIREVLSVGYRMLSQLLVDTGDLDTESGYKFFRREKILPILQHAFSTHWFWDTEITVLCRRHGFVIREIPVLFLRRFDKRSSVHILPDTVAYMKNLWELHVRINRIDRQG